MNVFELCASLSLDKNSYDKGLDDSEKSGKTWVNKMESTFRKTADVGAKTLKAAAQIGAAAIGAASAGVVALTKNAVESYAEYEQLVGGVETLFKDSADAVMAYADNAFETAGMSANEYMDTVTSFSASLLQGLDGDTAAAAEVANQAITDMSDNANKMGTSMESIQNAYQGFAKQNYTMLDNLKLGYGGTASEMARLVNESGVLGDSMTVSAESINEVSFDKIIEAIHVVQDNMGITGTTAAEAASTISGSLSMAKSAWENLITGIADENADFDTLIDNFVNSVSTAADNVIPRVEQAITGVGQLVESLLPVIVEQIPVIIDSVLPEIVNSGINMVNTLLQGISDNTEAIVTGALNIVETLINSIIEMLPQIIETGINIIVQLAYGLSESLPTLIPTMVEAVLTIVMGLLDNIDMVIDAALQLIVGLSEGLINALPILIEKAPVIISKLVTGLLQSIPELVGAAAELVAGLAGGLISSIPSLLVAVVELAMSIPKAIGDFVSSLEDIGGNLVSGLWEGIKNSWGNLVDNVKSLGSKLVGGIKDIFGIHSPSKVFAQIGDYCVQGFDEGMKDLADGSAVRDGINGALDAIDEIDGKTVSINANASPYEVTGGGVMQTILDKLTAFVDNMTNNSGYNAQLAGDITIPVYIGTELIDTMVVNANQRLNYRSGGR